MIQNANATKSKTSQPEQPTKCSGSRNLSAEYKALCHQAFNTARLNLNSFLSSDKKYNKPLAIITDVDETVLDNSPYDGKLILNNTSYNRESWVDWGNMEIAKAYSTEYVNSEDESINNVNNNYYSSY